MATVGFVDDFESYAPGALPTGPWYDWGGPAPGATVVGGGGGAGGSSQYITITSEPVRWFENPLNAKDQIVDFTFYMKSGGIDLFAGTSDVAEPPPWQQPNGQYGSNIGPINVNFGSGNVTYGSQVVGGLVAGSWNEITVRLISRNNGGTMGQGELYVNGVGSGVQSTFALGPDGLNVVDFWGSGDMDSWSIQQNGTAASLPWNGGTPTSWYPGTKGFQGGLSVAPDGTVYVASGSTTNGELYKYSGGTWTQLASRPSAGAQNENHGVAITSDGKIVVMAGGGFPNATNAYVYDIATDTWAAPVPGNVGPVQTYDRCMAIDAAGTMVFGGTIPGQGGMVGFDEVTGTFTNGQTTGPTAPGGWPAGYDFAYGGGDVVYELGTNPVSGMAGLNAYHISTNTWDDAGTLADLPVAFPGVGQSALTYVPDGVTTLYAIHQEWGVAGLYEYTVTGDALYAVLNGTDDLYRYDLTSGTWSVQEGFFPFTFGDGDDIAGGVPEPATISLLVLGGLALIRRNRK